MPRKSSDITITDQFCGAGGSSLGASSVPGVRVRMALNHWKLAIETHNTNFPETDHDCTDVSACDPRRYPSTNILITSPECTNHSLAKGKKRNGLDQRDMFVPAPPDPADERSRATMWDVPRFAEYHGYEYIIVENVPDATKWVQFPAWLHAMKLLGYRHRVLSLNSMFFWPCPQSRDRMYVVFWKEGNAAPDLDFTPRAFCGRCRADVHALQTWKLNRRTGRAHRVGKYDATGKQNQYFYSCPSCRQRVEPYYFCALNAIDLTIPAERIGDRKRPLKERTLERIRYGLEKFGRQHLVVTTRYTTGMDFRIREADSEVLPTQPGHYSHALVSPAIVERAWTHAPDNRATGGLDPLPAQTTQPTKAVAFPPILTTAGSRETAPASGADAVPTLTGSDRLGVTLPPGAIVHHAYNTGDRVSSLDQPLRAQTTQQSDGIVLPPMFMATNRIHHRPKGMEEPLDAFCTAEHHALVINGAALLTMRDWHGGGLVRGMDDPLGTQVASCTQDWLISRGRFLTPYTRTGVPRGLDEGMATVDTRDRQALIEAPEDLNVEDCYFRMLQPPEIQTGMAFTPEYAVLGNKRDQVKQLGNAVTPPVMQWIVARCVAALESGRGRRVA